MQVAEANRDLGQPPAQRKPQPYATQPYLRSMRVLLCSPRDLLALDDEGRTSFAVGRMKSFPTQVSGRVLADEAGRRTSTPTTRIAGVPGVQPVSLSFTAVRL